MSARKGLRRRGIGARIGALISLFVVLVAVLVMILTAAKAPITVVIATIAGFATIIGPILIALELENSKRTAKSEMLVNLNNYFHENASLMALYEALEIENRDHSGAVNFQRFGFSEFATFFSYYENLAMLVKNRVVSLDDIDDLFGYRFFSIMHCPWVQQTQVLPTSSSYRELFELYDEWIKYRERKAASHDPSTLTVGYEFRYSRHYLKERIYMDDSGLAREIEQTFEDDGENFELRSIGFEEMDDVLDLQLRSTAAIMGTDLYYHLTREELLESLHRDVCLGIFHKQRIVAFCIIIRNRPCERNLAKIYPAANQETTVTFDIVFVDPGYRGRGFLQRYLTVAYECADLWGACIILAVTSPDNVFAKENFLRANFEVLDLAARVFDGRIRIIFGKKILSKPVMSEN